MRPPGRTHPRPTPGERMAFRISTLRNTLDHVRFEWTPEGFARVVAHGLDPAAVHAALAGPGQRLLLQIDDDTLSVLIRTETGTLIEVWLTEDDGDGAREVFAA